MKFLIIQTAFLGDCVLTLPLINTLKKNINCAITVVTAPPGKEIFCSCSSVDSVIVYDKKGADKKYSSFFGLIAEIRESDFDAAFLPQRSFRSGLISRLAGIPERYGFKRGGAKFFCTEKIKYDWQIHEVERILQLSDIAGCEVKIRDFNIAPEPELAAEYRKLIPSNKKVIGVAPQSQWAAKRWPKEKFLELIHELEKEHFVVIVGSRKEDFAGKNILNLTGRTSIKELIAVSSLFDVLVSNDTGTVHVAAALEVPVVAIFGPTVPSLGFAPYGKKHAVVEVPLECRPCSLHGPRKCPKKHFKCMKEITVQKVKERVGPLLFDFPKEKNGSE